MSDRSSGLTCVFSAVMGVLLSAFVHSSWSVPNIYSDIASFWARGWIQAGQIPYVQAFFEYPPISGFIIYAARIVGGDYAGYYGFMGGLSLLTAALLAWSTWHVTRSLGTRLSPFYFIMPGIVVFGFYSFDLFHALFIVLSLQLLLEGRRSSSAVALGLAIATKLVGGLLLPVYLMEIRDWKASWRYVAVVAGTVALIYVPLAIANFGNLYQFVTYFQSWGLEDAWYVWIFQDPSTWQYAKSFGLILTGILLLRVYTLRVPMVPKAFLTLAAYLLGTFIYAPQFSIMLLPFVAILSVEDPALFVWDSFNVLIILSWFAVANPTLPPSWPQIFSLIRTGALAALCLALIRRMGVPLTTLVPWPRGKSTARRPTFVDSVQKHSHGSSSDDWN